MKNSNVCSHEMAGRKVEVGAGVEKSDKKTSMKCDKNNLNPCDLHHNNWFSAITQKCWLLACLLMLQLLVTTSHQQAAIIIDHHNQRHGQHHSGNNLQHLQVKQQQQQPSVAYHHFQPISLLMAQNRSINFTHVAVDELTNSIYVGATNWLFQLSGTDLRLLQAIRTGPAAPGQAGGDSLACSPTECHTQLQAMHELESVPLSHAHHVINLNGPWPAHPVNKRLFAGATMHTTSGGSLNSSFNGQQQTRPHGTATAIGLGTTANAASLSAQAGQPTTTPTSQLTSNGAVANPSSNVQNNYNKLLAIDHENRQLIVCGSLNQGACRRHQLGNVANFSEPIPVPVASNDEHSSTVALIPSFASTSKGPNRRPSSQTSGEQVLYVAATNSRIGPYRDYVPAISARSLDFSGSQSRAMQIIERSFDRASVDISFELRDYYLINYVHAFQHQDFIYFATVQRKSPLRQLEEQGYITRLARLCVNDLSFQSYTEMTLECRAPSNEDANQVDEDMFGDGVSAHSDQGQQQRFKTHNKATSSSTSNGINYNLLQDAHLMQAGSQLQQQLNLARHQSQFVLVGTFAQSRDHTTRSSQKSAICLFPMAQIERRFSENIDLCYNGTTKSRNMNYIAGSVNDCPKQQSSLSLGGNYCNEPIKLSGSLALTSEPIASYDSELLTSVTATLAPTSPLNMQGGAAASGSNKQTSSSRQHQVLLAGTSQGHLKRLVLVSNSANQKIRAIEFDSLQVTIPVDSNDSSAGNAILADLQLTPKVNPQLQPTAQQSLPNSVEHARAQYALVATSHRLLKVRINSCRASGSSAGQRHLGGQNSATAQNGSLVDDCLTCAQAQDPFCGWCSTSAACTTRDECLMSGLTASATNIHWTPFDSIRCSNYQPISPKNVPLQADAGSLIDVNVRLLAHNKHDLLASKLTQAQFSCHYDFLAHWNKSESMPRPSGSTTKASQARLNVHANTIAIGCPMPVHSQRPQLGASTPSTTDHLKVRLSVRLSSIQDSSEPDSDRQLIERALGMRSQQSTWPNGRSISATTLNQQHLDQADAIDRDLTLYDCTVHSSCHSCLSAGSLGRRWACAWCPLSQRCTHNASHPDFGCAASAVASTTPHSNETGALLGSHLTPSLDRAQANVLSWTIDKLHSCPRLATSLNNDDSNDGAAAAAASLATAPIISGTHSIQADSQTVGVADQTASGVRGQELAKRQPVEILVPNQSRRSIQVQLARPIQHYQREKRVMKLECLVDLEGAKGRLTARLVDNTNIVCQETLFSYQTEIALQKAQLSVILNDHQVIETTEVILYKCHLFGINPPALTSSVASLPALNSQVFNQLHQQPAPLHSSASWPSSASDFFTLIQSAHRGNHQQAQLEATAPLTINQPIGADEASSKLKQSDCSLCLNVERKYQCSWCSNQCKHSEQCAGHELAASTCPPPRIDLIHPNAGPIEGGTLLTIEGSNLGSNEREIQDKILVGGEPCQLIMYSVSTRIVCKTGPSLISGPQAATVFVGNRAGVTSALEKFHYKAVHLIDVNPRIGPVSGGTRLHLSGSNLNIGSRIQIYLDDIPCPLDSQYEITSNQIVCITGPNLLVNSMRITRLTLIIDNSTHHLPYPFTYQPDPIITQIEPAESFLSGGRLILIKGQHLSSPQSTKLMLYHESKPSLSNTTACMKQNDTLITCMTPAFSRDALSSATNNNNNNNNNDPMQFNEQLDWPMGNSLAYETGGGIKLKIMLLLDDVRSARNLDEYYHHLPHHIGYFEDPRLLPLPNQLVEYRDELVIAGEHLQMRQLDQDMLITVGADVCHIRTVLADRVVCKPPERIAPLYDSNTDGTRNRRLIERPVLPIVALIGSNLRFDIGYMQYTSAHYLPIQESALDNQQQQLEQQDSSNLFFASANYNGQMAPAATDNLEQQQQSNSNIGYLLLILLSLLGFIVAFGLTFMFAMARFKQSKAKQREYKRIQQLQMGSLDINGQPMTAAAFANGGLFDKLQHQPTYYMPQGHQQQQQLRANVTQQPASGSSKSKPFYQFFTQNSSSAGSFFSSPLMTDISSLIGVNNNNNSSPIQQQQHVVKLNANGTIMNNVSQPMGYNYASASTSSSSPGSSNGQLLSSSTGAPAQVQHYAVGQLGSYETSTNANLLQRSSGGPTNSTRRNFNWTQEAPSTIVPYAVIEASNLTLEGKQAIKEYV